MPKGFRLMKLPSKSPLENNMNAKLSIVIAGCMALFVSACGSSPQSLILGKWEVESAIKMTAEFSRDGTAKITMFGQTLQGTYKLNAENELEWTLNGKTVVSVRCPPAKAPPCSLSLVLDRTVRIVCQFQVGCRHVYPTLLCYAAHCPLQFIFAI